MKLKNSFEQNVKKIKIEVSLKFPIKMTFTVLWRKKLPANNTKL